MKKLTHNDERVLFDVGYAPERSFSGYVPHGSRDWTAVYRLLQGKLVCAPFDGHCECDRHENQVVMLFRLTPEGTEIWNSIKEKWQ